MGILQYIAARSIEHIIIIIIIHYCNNLNRLQPQILKVKVGGNLSVPTQWATTAMIFKMLNTILPDQFKICTI